MGRIRKVVTVALPLLFIVTVLLTASTFAERTPEFEEMNKMYRKIYPYMTYKDTVYTFETEYNFPEGFNRPDSTELSDFSNWVARMPLWYAYKSIGNWKGRKIKDYKEVSRAVHVPWKGPLYKDHAFPIRILAEYFVYKNDYDGFTFDPFKGEIITFEKWLSGKPAKKPLGEIIFQPDFQKDTSLSEFYNYMNFTLTIMNHGTLIKNCYPIRSESLMPGDVYIACDSAGKKGKTVFIQNKLVDKDGNAIYAISHSAEDACDFHIPLVNNDKENPWMTIEQIVDYVGENSIKGFYRFKLFMN